MSRFSSRWAETTMYFPFARPSSESTLLRVDPGAVVLEHLGHGRSGDEDVLLADALREQVAAAVLGVGQVHVAHVVDDAPVDLLGHVLVEAAVPGLHVEDGDLEALGGDGAERAVRVAEHEERLGAGAREEPVGAADDVAERLAQVLAGRLEEVVGLPDGEVPEEDLVQRVVPVLAGVDERVVEVAVAGGDHPREPDDLRPRANYRHHLELLHRTFSANVSGRFGSKTSLDQKRVTISPSPRFSMECVYPGGMSTTFISSPLTS